MMPYAHFTRYFDHAAQLCTSFERNLAPHRSVRAPQVAERRDAVTERDLLMWSKQRTRWAAARQA
jgi:hypothetical protein